MANDQQFLRNTILACIFAFLAMFLLAFGSYLVMSQNIKHESVSSGLVSLSGKEHMLSQRIALLSLSLVNTQDDELRKRIRAEIKDLADSMEKSHAKLINQEEESGAQMSESIRDIYFGETTLLDQKIRGFVREIRKLTEAPNEALFFNNPNLTSIVITSTALLSDLSALTAKYREEGESGIQRLQRIEELVLLVSILTLTAMAAGIFYPMLKRLAKELKQRSQTAAEFEVLNEKLKEYTTELERSNKALDQFSSIIAHDLRAPLRTISVFGEMLQKKSAVFSTPQELEFVNLIQGAIKRMDRLVVDLLAYSRISSQVQSFVSISLNEIMDEVRFDLRSLISEVGAQINVAKLPVIEADRTQIRQLLQNLVQNAIKFRHPERPVVLNISSQPAARAGHHSGYCITVQDNGIGFDPVHATRIFQVFKKLHTDDQYDGVGMGLAICKRVVERHNGQISAEGVPHSGAKITFILPEKQHKLSNGTTSQM